MALRTVIAARTETIPGLLAARADDRGDKIAYTYLADGERDERSLTFARLDLEARAIAARLQRDTERGDRAVILTDDGMGFIRSFLACQHAGVIAVPTYPPTAMRPERRIATLRAIAHDCGARVVLTSGPADLRGVVAGGAPEVAALPWIDVDSVPAEAAEYFRRVRVLPDDVAFLQYTSGSTSAPKGVVVRHDALMSNERLFTDSFRITSESVLVGWLPLSHDMGLMGKVLDTLYAGATAVLMPPLAFVQRPSRWLWAITRYLGTTSGAPNFGYELCVRRIPPEERAGLDLRSWDCAFNGAEPVRAATLDAFTATFAPHGFDPRAWSPAYGLAESTLMATAPDPDRDHARLTVDLAAYREGRLVAGGDHVLVTAGRARLHRRVEIVDPETRLRVAPGTVGEIWLAGPDLGSGYWNRPEESERTFAARLADTGEGPFLRTGDLGAMLDGDLYVTGRLKDLIIVGGLNHYPQDIEATVEAVDPSIRRGCCAAFALERDGREQVIVVAEVKPPAGDVDLDGLARAVRAAVGAEHGIGVDEVALVPPRTVPKTSSGKLQRSACRAAFERGELTPARGLEIGGVGVRRDVDVVADWIADQIAAVLQVDVGAVAWETPFSELGLTSIHAVELSDDLQRWVDVPLPPTLAYDYPTIAAVAEYVAAELRRRDRSLPVPSPERTAG